MSKFFSFIWDHRQNLLFLLLVLISLSALSLSSHRRFYLARRVNRAILAPFQLVVARVDYFLQLKSENVKLRKSNFLLNLELYRLQEAKRQNQRLEALLEFSRRYPVRFIACRIISGGLGEKAHVFIIDKGFEDGLSPNLPVLVPEGLVGKTVEVDPHRTVVQLYSHPEFRVSAKPRGKEDRAIVGSSQNNKMYMFNIPLRNQLEPGDLIVSSGMGGIFPKGIPVGRIVGLEEEEEMRIKMRARMEPAVDLDKVSEVFVLADTAFIGPGDNLLFEATDSLTQLWERP
ncbi:MAG: rod shape-determining protein MreC [Candidatus Glassbacteria bacterium]|nr:rod shape-determining protein MreC [Candidatus Glassbacteria bacterium]